MNNKINFTLEKSDCCNKIINSITNDIIELTHQLYYFLPYIYGEDIEALIKIENLITLSKKIHSAIIKIKPSNSFENLILNSIEKLNKLLIEIKSVTAYMVTNNCNNITRYNYNNLIDKYSICFSSLEYICNKLI